MDETANLKLPYIMAAQAQKHVTHNEAIRSLDAIVQLAVLDRDLSAPPVAPQDGDRFIVAIGATGEWLNHDLELAAFQDGAWMFHTPREGWIAWISDEDGAVVWDGTSWAALTSGSGGSSGTTGSFLLLGVNETAEPANRFKLSSPASLFDHEGNGHQLKVNKASSSDTASLLYQNAYAGRAEMGLAGNDDFSIKVSPDGSTWHDAIIVDRTDGSVTFPNSTVTGATGPQGPAGPQGPVGPPGLAGSDGADGAPGADGIGVPAGGTTGQILAKASGTDFDTQWVAAPSGGNGGGGGAPAVIIKDVKSVTTHGGAFSAGSWETRDLNTFDRNTGNLATLAGNQFTLPAGTYFIRAIAPAYRVLRHKIRLYDITNATDIASSPVEYGSASTEVTTKAELATVVTLSASAVFEIQHICQTTKTVNGFGINSDGISGAAESVYTQVLIWAA